MLVTAAVLCLSAKADQQPPKLRLPDSVSPASYRVALTLDPAKDSFDGTIKIKVDIKEPVEIIWLNAAQLHPTSAVLKSSGKTLSATVVDGDEDFVGLKFDSAVPAGKSEIDIVYTGAIQTQGSAGIFRMLDNGNKYLYTQFESIDARRAFPCFDEPSYKVPWQLTLTIPSGDTAVSNTTIAKQEEHGSETT